MPMARNNIRLKINGLICVSVKSKTIPTIRTATFMPIPKSLWATSDATARPHVLLPCSLVIRYTRRASPLTDSAGTIVSTNMPYQTKRYDFMTDSLISRKLAKTRHDTEKKNTSIKLSAMAKAYGTGSARCTVAIIDRISTWKR